jgi:hypothetical protein
LVNYNCIIDDQIYHFINYLKEIFPNSVFIYIVRDGRATVNSLLLNHDSFENFKWSDYPKSEINLNYYLRGNSADTFYKMHRQMGHEWEEATNRILRVCKSIQNSCLLVYYEILVIEPQYYLKKLIQFLKLNENNSENMLDIQTNSNSRKYEMDNHLYGQMWSHLNGYMPVKFRNEFLKTSLVMSKLGYTNLTFKFNNELKNMNNLIKYELFVNKN